MVGYLSECKYSLNQGFGFALARVRSAGLQPCPAKAGLKSCTTSVVSAVYLMLICNLYLINFVGA